jgi:hypothetical protein
MPVPGKGADACPFFRIPTPQKTSPLPDKIHMDRRRELRVNVNQPVRITVLGEYRHEMQGNAVDFSGHGIRVVVPSSVSPGNPVRIDLDDAMLLGDICYCRPNGSGFTLGVQLDQALSGLAELARLNHALLDLQNRDREGVFTAR